MYLYGNSDVISDGGLKIIYNVLCMYILHTYTLPANVYNVADHCEDVSCQVNCLGSQYCSFQKD